MAVVETRYGKVRGTEIADGVLAWRGIPYAKPPVGDLRLRPPEPPEPWGGTRDALAYGNRAPQPELRPLPSDAPPMAEDCLYLNVTAPAGAGGRPVLFWLHGGGYEGGQGPDGIGDGVAFARGHGLVIVTMNYRLGALGFLDVPGEGPTGAFGLHDQIAALRWTRENIAAFGGDPEQITVYGLSAGAKSVTNLLASPLTRGLIARAAESSGGDHVKDAAQARAITARFLAELGAAPEQLRSVPAADILHTQTAIAAVPRSVWVWRPSVDGAALTAKPLTAIAAGAAAGIPLLLQTCERECAMYALLAPDAPRQAGRVLAEYFGQGTAAKILASYSAQYPDLDEAGKCTAVMTDERYVASTERLADAQAAHGNVWRSRYDGPHDMLEADPQLAQYAPLLRGAHGADVVAIWQGGPGGADDGSVPAALHSTWGKFATSGDPGWARYTVPGKPAMIFTEDGPRVSADPFSHAREIWSALDWQPATWWSFDGID